MRAPDPPYVELGFYFANMTGDAAIAALCRHLVSCGAAYNGPALISHINSLHDTFASIYDLPHCTHVVNTVSEAECLFANSTLRILQLTIRNGTDIVPDANEIVTQLRVSDKAKHADRHPVAIWVEGCALSFGGDSIPRSARRIGRKTFKAFSSLVRSLNPSYAAITVDYGLECPADLSYNESLAFRDCFVSKEFVGAQFLDNLVDRLHGAYYEQLATGLILCCSELFAPTFTSIDSRSAFALSAMISRRISLAANIG